MPRDARPSPVRGAQDRSERETQPASRDRRLRQELLIRALVAVVILGFNHVFRATTGAQADSVITVTLLLALVLNGPYYLAARTGLWLRAQAYARMLLDILFITAGLYGAGGLAAAPYLAVYALVPVYAGTVFSSTACVLATGAATVSYVALVALQHGGWLAPVESLLPDNVRVAAFNLLVVNVVGGLTALLALALRRSRRRLRTTYRELSNLMETIPDVIWVVDLEGRLLLWNRRLETVSGMPPARLRDRPLETLFPEGDRAAAARALHEGGERGQFEFEGHLLSGDGMPVAYHWTGARLQDDDGRVTSLTGVGRDLTLRKQAEETIRRREEEVRQLQKMEAVGRLAGGIAHDFNNLLQVIKGRAEYMLRRLSAEDLSRVWVAAIEDAADRGAALTRQLLAFSRKQVFQPKVVELNAVVTSTARLLERLLGPEITLEVRLGETVRGVKGDLAQLEQVIMNLSINARDAMPGGGRLLIGTTRIEVDEALARRHEGARPGPYAVLEVCDTGVGMEPAVRAKIFEPFFTTKPAGKGTGLGLAIVYGIVKQHDGWIGVETEPGRGTTFRVHLPHLETAPDPSIASEGIDALRGSETVLLAEDEDEVRKLAGDILRAAGYRVLSARDGGEALTVADRYPRPIDVLVADVVMPGMNGDELSRRLRARRPGMPVLFVSGHTEKLIEPETAAPGTALLRKPFTAAGLARGVRQVLQDALKHRGAPA